MYVKRSLQARFTLLQSTFPVLVVTGARQVGKSTLVRHMMGDRVEVVTFDPHIDVGNARADPDLFLANHRTPLFLDEIQYVPEVVSALKRRLDQGSTPGQYVLSGSQQWSVIRGLAESLAGRCVFLDLDGFSLAEVAGEAGASWLEAWLRDPAAFVASRAGRLAVPRAPWEQLWRGWLPEAQAIPLETVADFHAAYFRTYVERDVRSMADVADWELFVRFVRVAAALTGQEVNHSLYGRAIGVDHETVKRWLAILKATFQWFELPAWSGNVVRRVSHRPKGYFADTGLACWAQSISSPVALGGHPLFGALFETAVAGEVRKACARMAPSPTLYHWRAHGGAEVDMLLERDGVLYPLEVKATSHPTRADAAGFQKLRAAHPALRVGPGLVVAPTESREQLTEFDYAWPWDARLIGG